MAKKKQSRPDVEVMVTNLIELLKVAKEEAASFDAKGNKAAARRCRAYLMEVSKDCKRVRTEIQARVNAL